MVDVLAFTLFEVSKNTAFSFRVRSSCFPFSNYAYSIRARLFPEYYFFVDPYLAYLIAFQLRHTLLLSSLCTINLLRLTPLNSRQTSYVSVAHGERALVQVSSSIF
jgi:hypothetical protein